MRSVFIFLLFLLSCQTAHANPCDQPIQLSKVAHYIYLQGHLCPGDGKKFIVQEITKPFYLKTNQFASTFPPNPKNKLEIKITPIKGKHLTNEVTFAPAPLEPIKNPKRTQTFKVKKNKKTTFKVGRS